jgi:sulfate permease, SulP family
MGAGNLVAGFCSGFVQSGGASQTAAADGAGGKSQFSTVVCAGLLLLTGAFLAPLFEHLPQATLAAIVVVAVSGFLDVAELRRIAGIRRSGLLLAGLALAGVLALGVLQGLVITAGLALVYVIQRLSRPSIGALGREPHSGAWGRLDRNEGLEQAEGVLVMRADSTLLYPNSNAVRQSVVDAVAVAEPRPRVVVLDLSNTSDLDVQSADALTDLGHQLAEQDVELRLAGVRRLAAQVLQRARTTDVAALAPTIDAAVHPGEVSRDHPAP